MTNHQPTSPSDVDYGGREIPGRWVVLAMFAFAVCVIATLFVYWALHRGPFLPLQRAIAAKYPESRPLVEGGQRKMHRGTPTILRIVMEVPFDPNADENRATLDGIVDQLLILAEDHHGLAPYDSLEAHFFLQERENRLHEHRVDVDLASRNREHHDDSDEDPPSDSSARTNGNSLLQGVPRRV